MGRRSMKIAPILIDAALIDDMQIEIVLAEQAKRLVSEMEPRQRYATNYAAPSRLLHSALVNSLYGRRRILVWTMCRPSLFRYLRPKINTARVMELRRRHSQPILSTYHGALS